MTERKKRNTDVWYYKERQWPTSFYVCLGVLIPHFAGRVIFDLYVKRPAAKRDLFCNIVVYISKKKPDLYNLLICNPRLYFNPFALYLRRFFCFQLLLLDLFFFYWAFARLHFGEKIFFENRQDCKVWKEVKVCSATRYSLEFTSQHFSGMLDFIVLIWVC